MNCVRMNEYFSFLIVCELHQSQPEEVLCHVVPRSTFIIAPVETPLRTQEKNLFRSSRLYTLSSDVLSWPHQTISMSGLSMYDKSTSMVASSLSATRSPVTNNTTLSIIISQRDNITIYIYILMHFESEEQAKQMAQDEILKILNDKQYLNPDKFDKLHTNFKRKIETLESQIAFTIRDQIESINSTRNFIDECFKNVEKCEVEVEQLNDIYSREARFHRECEAFERLSIFRRNVGVMLDQLKYFFNVKSQIEKIELLFHQGPDNYEQINFKLLTLTDIRDNVVDNIKSDSKVFLLNITQATSKEMQIIIQEFQCLSEFEEKFYNTIFSQFEMTLLVALKNPALLITLLRIVEAGDKILVGRQREPRFKAKVLDAIQKGINKKFEDRLKDQKEAIMVLEHSKFTANDLILVLDHVVKCFPKHYDIFGVYERCYKMNIEKRIMPFLDDEEEVKKSYGTLINLLNWVDSYDGLLLR